MFGCCVRRFVCILTAYHLLFARVNWGKEHSDVVAEELSKLASGETPDLDRLANLPAPEIVYRSPTEVAEDVNPFYSMLPATNFEEGIDLQDDEFLVKEDDIFILANMTFEEPSYDDLATNSTTGAHDEAASTPNLRGSQQESKEQNESTNQEQPAEDGPKDKEKEQEAEPEASESKEDSVNKETASSANSQETEPREEEPKTEAASRPESNESKSPADETAEPEEKEVKSEIAQK